MKPEENLRMRLAIYLTIPDHRRANIQKHLNHCTYACLWTLGRSQEQNIHWQWGNMKPAHRKAPGPREIWNRDTLVAGTTVPPKIVFHINQILCKLNRTREECSTKCLKLYYKSFVFPCHKLQNDHKWLMNSVNNLANWDTYLCYLKFINTTLTKMFKSNYNIFFKSFGCFYTHHKML